MISLIISNFNICQIKYYKTNCLNDDAGNANYKHIKLVTTALDNPVVVDSVVYDDRSWFL